VHRQRSVSRRRRREARPGPQPCVQRMSTSASRLFSAMAILQRRTNRSLRMPTPSASITTRGAARSRAIRPAHRGTERRRTLGRGRPPD
jgi:hypothetical protein